MIRSVLPEKIQVIDALAFFITLICTRSSLILNETLMVPEVFV